MGAEKIRLLGEKAILRVIELKTQLIPESTIADTLNGEFQPQEAVVRKDVELLLRSLNPKIKQQILKDKDDFNLKLAKQNFDTLSRMKNICSDLEKVYYDLRKSPDKAKKIFNCSKCGHQNHVPIENYNNLTKISSQILEYLKHFDRVTGKLKNQNMNITYNYASLSHNISLAMPHLLSELEKKGLIKIMKKRLKEHFANQGLKLSEEDEEMEEEDEEGITEEIRE